VGSQQFVAATAALCADVLRKPLGDEPVAKGLVEDVQVVVRLVKERVPSRKCREVHVQSYLLQEC
jgi:hypothetical protein